MLNKVHRIIVALIPNSHARIVHPTGIPITSPKNTFNAVFIFENLLSRLSIRGDYFFAITNMIPADQDTSKNAESLCASLACHLTAFREQPARKYQRYADI